MPRKPEIKATDVLEYFATAPIDAAVLVLQLAAQAVQKRRPKKEESERLTARAGQPATAGGGVRQGPPAGSPPPRRTRVVPATPAVAPTTTAPAGEVEPGLPGMAPVA